MGLCCLRALRGLCGFCVREWLGGLKACGVFAPIFHFFASVFVSLHAFCPAFSPLSFFALVVFLCSLSWFVFVVSLSLTDE